MYHVALNAAFCSKLEVDVMNTCVSFRVV